MGCFWLVILTILVPQFLVTGFLAANNTLPGECVTPYQVNSFDIKIDLRYLLLWFNILVLSISIIIVWIYLIDSHESSICFRVLGTLIVGFLFVMLFFLAMEALHVLFENNPACWHTAYGALVMIYLVLVFLSMCSIPLISCYFVMVCSPSLEPETLDP